jgi:hypothetical protein
VGAIVSGDFAVGENEAERYLLVGLLVHRQHRGCGYWMPAGWLLVLRVYDTAVATYAAAAINIVVAVAALALAVLGPKPAADTTADDRPETKRIHRAPDAVYICRYRFVRADGSRR